MATTTGTFVFYESWFEQLAMAVNLQTDTFKMALMADAYSPSASTQSKWADISSDEVSGNGYAQQTLSHSSDQFSRSGGTATLDFDNPVFSASGGDWEAEYWVVYDDTPTDSSPVLADPLVAYGLLDDTPGTVTVTDGNTLTVNINASGLFTIS